MRFVLRRRVAVLVATFGVGLYVASATNDVLAESPTGSEQASAPSDNAASERSADSETASPETANSQASGNAENQTSADSILDVIDSPEVAATAPAGAQAQTTDVQAETVAGPEQSSPQDTKEQTAEGNENKVAAEPILDTIPVKLPEQKKPIPKDVPAPNSRRIEEIVVTATKREESVRQIPATVNVLSGQDLEKTGARETEDFLKLVPGVTMQEGDTASSRTISIRGIGPQPGANVTTGVLIDDVSMSDPYASYLIPDLDPFDLHDLEVLKGPQGTLFGAGALNGAIRYVLNKPELGVVQAKGFANWLTINEGGSGLNYGAALNVPIGETFALRAVGMKQKLPGLYDDINANGKHDIDADAGNKYMYRVLGLWKPIDELTVNAFFLSQHNYRGDVSIANANAAEKGYGLYARTNTPGSSTSTQDFQLANLDVHYDLPWFTIISETSRSKKFQDINYDGSAAVDALAELGVQSLRLHSQVQTEAISQEIRFASLKDSDSPWNWIGGAYYNNYKAYLLLNAPIANTEVLGTLLGPNGVLPILGLLPLNLVSTEDGLLLQSIRYDPLSAKETSLFGELTRKLFDNQLEITIGGRAYREKMFVQPITGGIDGPLGSIIGATDAADLRSAGFSPKLSIKYQWTDDILVYTTAARGFQFGGVNSPAPIPTDNVYPLTFKPSTIWSYEVGTRTDWLEHTLQFDLTGFWIRWTDMQLSQGTPSGNTDYVDNVGKARSVGVESVLKWATPIPGVVLTNSAAYIRATVQEPYTTSDDHYIPKGQDLPAAPHFASSTSLAFTLPFESFSIGTSVTYSYTGKAYSNVWHETTLYNYGTLDANLSFTAPQLQMAPELGINVGNLLDRHARTGARYLNGGSDELVNYNKPRAITARVSFHF